MNVKIKSLNTARKNLTPSKLESRQPQAPPLLLKKQQVEMYSLACKSVVNWQLK